MALFKSYGGECYIIALFIKQIDYTINNTTINNTHQRKTSPSTRKWNRLEKIYRFSWVSKFTPTGKSQPLLTFAR